MSEPKNIPALHAEIGKLKNLLRDWDEWAEWFVGERSMMNKSLQSIKERTEEVLKP